MKGVNWEEFSKREDLSVDLIKKHIEDVDMKLISIHNTVLTEEFISEYGVYLDFNEIIKHEYITKFSKEFFEKYHKDINFVKLFEYHNKEHTLSDDLCCVACTYSEQFRVHADRFISLQQIAMCVDVFSDSQLAYIIMDNVKRKKIEDIFNLFYDTPTMDRIKKFDSGWVWNNFISVDTLPLLHDFIDFDSLLENSYLIDYKISDELMTMLFEYATKEQIRHIRLYKIDKVFVHTMIVSHTDYFDFSNITFHWLRDLLLEDVTQFVDSGVLIESKRILKEHFNEMSVMESFTYMTSLCSDDISILKEFVNEIGVSTTTELICNKLTTGYHSINDSHMQLLEPIAFTNHLISNCYMFDKIIQNENCTQLIKYTINWGMVLENLGVTDYKLGKIRYPESVIKYICNNFRDKIFEYFKDDFTSIFEEEQRHVEKNKVVQVTEPTPRLTPVKKEMSETDKLYNIHIASVLVASGLGIYLLYLMCK